jgi:hypothetical protein
MATRWRATSDPDPRFQEQVFPSREGSRKSGRRGHRGKARCRRRCSRRQRQVGDTCKLRRWRHQKWSKGNNTGSLRAPHLGPCKKRNPRPRDRANPLFVFGVIVDQRVLRRECPATREVGQTLTNQPQRLLRYRTDPKPRRAKSRRKPIGFTTADRQPPANGIPGQDQIGSPANSPVRMRIQKIIRANSEFP